MKPRILMFTTALLLTLCATTTVAQELAKTRDDAAEQLPMRRYELVFAPDDDLQTPATASPTLLKATMDAYLYGIRPHLNPTMDSIVGTIWSIFFTYQSVLWPHEFGHWLRARQVDSRFNFESFNPLLPHTTVDMPANAPPADSALLSVGGFEVNSMVARRAQMDFYQNGAAYSDELGQALVHKMFFFIYTLIFPASATEPNTWVETRGDPVHFVLPVYERHTGRPAIKTDGEVDSDLVQLYREAWALSLLWNALDPGFVQQAMAFADSGFDARRAWMPVRTNNFGWTWGTLFNPSPLGYELYLMQYLVLGDRLVEVSLKYGRPMKNLGVRLASPNLIEIGRLRAGVELEGWDQDVYGMGGSVAARTEVRVVQNLGVVGSLGYKSDGYAIGRGIDQTAFGAVGLSYAFEHSDPDAAAQPTE